MTLTLNQLRLLALSRRRIVTDTTYWFIAYLLIVGYTTNLLWSRGQITEWTDGFRTALGDSVIITTALALFVYFNLFILKRHILEAPMPKRFRYSIYFLILILTSITYAHFCIFMDARFLKLVLLKIDPNLIMAAVLAFGLLSTFMLYLKELDEKYMRAVQKGESLKGVNASLEEELEEAKERLKKVELTIHQDHIKIGGKKKWEKICLEEILFIKADNNKSTIFLTWGKLEEVNVKLGEFVDLLPKYQFIRIHRSYIIAKNKVVSRNGNLLFFNSKDEQGKPRKIQITEKYLEEVEKDPVLGF